MSQPDVPGQSIKNLLPQRVTFRNTWMVEVLCVIVRHPELCHDASRSTVSDGRVRHDLREANLSEAKLKCCLRRFHGEPLSPERPCQPPTDFDGRREGGGKADVQQSDSAHEFAGCSRFQGPEAEAVRGLMADLEINPGVAGISCCERAEMLHDGSIFRHFGKRLPV